MIVLPDDMAVLHMFMFCYAKPDKSVRIVSYDMMWCSLEEKCDHELRRQNIAAEQMWDACVHKLRQLPRRPLLVVL